MSVKERQQTLVLLLIFLLGCRLKNFDPDNDDESLSNLEAQCDRKEEVQPLHGAELLPADSLEYMESGRRRKASSPSPSPARHPHRLVPQLHSLPACRPPPEQHDVHDFLLANMSNGGILELMMRYLKAVGRRFLEEWPRGLATVVLEVHQAWRRHSMGLPNPLLRDANDRHLRVTREKTHWSPPGLI